MLVVSFKSAPVLPSQVADARGKKTILGKAGVLTPICKVLLLILLVLIYLLSWYKFQALRTGPFDYNYDFLLSCFTYQIVSLVWLELLIQTRQSNIWPCMKMNNNSYQDFSSGKAINDIFQTNTERLVLQKQWY